LSYRASTLRSRPDRCGSYTRHYQCTYHLDLCNNRSIWKKEKEKRRHSIGMLIMSIFKTSNVSVSISVSTRACQFVCARESGVRLPDRENVFYSHFCHWEARSTWVHTTIWISVPCFMPSLNLLKAQRLSADLSGSPRSPQQVT
jgi:hypothetical protein